MRAVTAHSPAARPASGPVLAAALAGIVALAFVGAPQSVNVVMLVGLDQPQVIGSQLLIGLAGAVGSPQIAAEPASPGGGLVRHGRRTAQGQAVAVTGVSSRTWRRNWPV